MVQQIVQVSILGTHRLFTYSWSFDPQAGGMPLRIGARVELPPNIVQEEGSSGTVAKFGSDYTGPMKAIVRVIEDDRREEDSLWGGWEYE